jgi:hypothetical protein
MNDFESLVLDALANEVVNDVDVFSSLVVSVVFGKVDSASIVNEDGGRRGFEFVNTKLNQKATQPQTVTDGH